MTEVSSSDLACVRVGLRLHSAQPCMITTARNAQNRALARNAVGRSMLMNGGVLQSSFLAKYAAVFPRISTSSVFSASWRLSRAFSSRSWRSRSLMDCWCAALARH